MRRNRRGNSCPTCGLGIPCGALPRAEVSASGLRSSGTVLQIRGGQASRRNFTVRRVSGGVGVERIFPVDSPRVETVEVTRRGSVRRARLYYLRDRIGKRAKVREQHRAVDEAQTMEKRAARKARRDDRRQAIRNKRDARKQAQTAAPSAPAAEPSQQEE